MNKLFSKIATLSIGLAMAVGVGVALGQRDVQQAEAAGQNDWTAVTSLSGINTTDVYVIGGGSNYHNGTITTSGSSIHFLTSAFGENAPASDEAAGTLKFEATGTANVYKMKLTSGKYLTASKASSGGAALSDSDDNGWLLSYSSGFNAIYQKAYSSKYASLRYRSSSSDLRTYQAVGQNDPSTSESAFKIWKYAPAADIQIKTITAVTLSKDSVPLNFGGTITATATYTDNDANEPFVWTSSNESVATIAKSSTYGVANVTLAGATGQTVITAAAKHDEANIKASVTLTVTEAVAINAYDMTFSGTSDSNTDYASAADDDAATALFRANASGDGQYVSVVKAESQKVYDGKESTVKLGAGSAKGILTLTTTANIKALVIEAKTYGTDDTTMQVSVGTNDAQEVELGSSFEYGYYTFTNAANKIKIAGKEDNKNRFYIRNLVLIIENKTAELGAYNCAVNLLNATAEGCSEKSESKLSAVWTAFASQYETMKAGYAGMDDLIKATDPNEAGNVIEKAIARYKVIVEKYGFADFAGKGYEKSILFTPLTDIGNNAGYVIIIAVVTMCSLAFGIVILTNKRKHQ